jgi:endo-1,4-beta-xylanase
LSRHVTRRRLLSSAATLGLFGATRGSPASAASDDALSQLAARSGRHFGTAVHIEEIRAEADLRGSVLRECSSLTPEIALKWDAVERSPGAFRFGPVDELLQFANQQGLRFHGHALLWHGSTPDWAQAQLRSQRSWTLVQRYMEAVLSRYRGAIGQWDVVNEPIETGYRMDGLRGSVFLEVFGPDYIARALHEARRLAPAAELMVNEFSLEADIQVESDRRYHFLKLLERLKRAGVPLDGVGLQAHLDLSMGPVRDVVYAPFLREIAGLGLFIVITELDVKEHDYAQSVERRDRAVADATARYLDIVLAQPAVRGVSTWGMSDRHSWLRITPEDLARHPGSWKDGSTPGFNRGLPFDSSMRRKPMYHAIANALRHAPARGG